MVGGRFAGPEREALLGRLQELKAREKSVHQQAEPVAAIFSLVVVWGAVVSGARPQAELLAVAVD